jgi:hypothetical protein
VARRGLPIDLVIIEADEQPRGALWSRRLRSATGRDLMKVDEKQIALLGGAIVLLALLAVGAAALAISL